MLTEKDQKEIENARSLLRKHGYFVDNLWCVDDVMSVCKCSIEDAHSILSRAMENGSTYDQIWMCIDYEIELAGHERLDL